MRRVLNLYRSSVGKKVMMAVSGAILVLFVFVHMLGNLKIYQGQEKIDAYGEFLREVGAPVFPHHSVLWILRIGLLAAVGIHILAAVQLTLQSRKARDTAYERKESIVLSYASRTMRWGGVLVLAFIIYHLLHFTTGTVHPDFEAGAVYSNMVIGFSQWPVSVAYIIAMITLGLHLYHGIWSGMQTLGLAHSRFETTLRRAAAAFSLVVVVGNISIPISVLTGVVG